MSMPYQNSGMTLSKVYYSNTGHHFCKNSALLLEDLFYILEKIPNIAKKQHIFP